MTTTITGRNHPADQAVCRPASIATMTTEDLHTADVELGRRAVLLGKPGKISRPHQAVKNALATASN